MKATSTRPVRLLAWSALLAAVHIGSAPRVHGAERMALVVGNQQYRPADRLRTPLRDAEAMERKLRELGFEVSLVRDAGRSEMTRQLDAFVQEVSRQKAKVAFFYYSGHATAIGRDNYLIPVDADPVTPAQLATSSVPFGQVFERLQASGVGLKILVLDASRANTFPAGTRSTASGLERQADEFVPEGTLVAFSASPRSTEVPSVGEHSQYTGALLAELSSPQPVVSMFLAAAERVVLATQERQQPMLQIERLGEGVDFSFVPLDREPVECPPGTRREKGECVSGKVICKPAGTQWNAATARCEPAPQASDPVVEPSRRP